MTVTRSDAVARISEIAAKSGSAGAAVAGAFSRANSAANVDASIACPSEKRNLGRSVKTHVKPSGDCVHRCAKPGSGTPAALIRVSPSNWSVATRSDARSDTL